MTQLVEELGEAVQKTHKTISIKLTERTVDEITPTVISNLTKLCETLTNLDLLLNAFFNECKTNRTIVSEYLTDDIIIEFQENEKIINRLIERNKGLLTIILDMIES